MPRLTLTLPRRSSPPGGSFRLNSASPQSRGLLGWWPFIDSRGCNVLRDRWGLNPGSFSGTAPAWENNVDQGWSLAFSGTQYVDFGNRDLWNFNAQSFAFSFGFCTTSTNVGYIVSKTDGSSQGWLLYLGSGALVGRLRFWLRSGAATLEQRTVNSYHDGLWHHALCVAEYAGSNYSLRIYVDGKEDHQPSANGTVANLTNAYPLRIGASSTGATGYIGKLRDLRIYRGNLGLNEAWQQWAPETRWDLYRSLKQRTYYDPEAADTVLLSGTAAGTSTASAILTIARQLSATISSQGTVTGVLTISRLLSQVTNGASTTAGTLTIQRLLAATATGTSTAEGIATIARLLGVTAAGSSTAEGVLAITRLLAGTLAGAGTATGNLEILRLLSAAVAGSSTVSGSLEIQRLLAAVISGTSTATGTLTIEQRQGLLLLLLLEGMYVGDQL